MTDSPPHLMRGLLRSWPLAQQRAFFESDLGVPLALEAETGKLFPVSNRARDVRDALVEHARQRGVVVPVRTPRHRTRPRRSDGWRVQTDGGDIDRGARRPRDRRVVGPATGSDGGGLTIAERARSSRAPVYPALTPLVAEPAVHAALSGVSLPVRLRARGPGTDDRGDGRVSVHASRLQRPVGARHLARRGAQSHERRATPRSCACSGRRSTRGRGKRALDVRRGLVVNAIAGHLPQRLAAQLHDGGRRPVRSPRRRICGARSGSR